MHKMTSKSTISHVNRLKTLESSPICRLRNWSVRIVYFTNTLTEARGVWQKITDLLLAIEENLADHWNPSFSRQNYLALVAILDSFDESTLSNYTALRLELRTAGFAKHTFDEAVKEVLLRRDGGAS